MKKVIIGILLCLIFINTSYSQPFDSAIASDLQFKLDSLKNTHNIKGISASVYYSNGGLWQGVSGDSHNGVPITADMKFGIASNTKLFTAVSLLKLEENNILTLDDELSQWIGPLNNVDPNIKIKQLLNHSSGLFDFIDVTSFADSVLINPNRVFTSTEVVNWIDPPIFPAGTNTSYSNTNFLVAGLVAESANNQTIEQYIRNNILTPNSLDNTFFPIDETVLGTIAHPWANQNDINNIPRISTNTIAWSAGAMYSNSSDMNNWYQKLFNAEIVSNASLNKIITTQNNFGLGIFLINIDGRTVYGHEGDIGGYRSIMLYDSLTQAIVCILINQNPAPVAIVGETLLLALVNGLSVLNTDNHETLNFKIKLFPNPSRDNISIDVPNYITVKESNLYDLKGNLLKNTTRTIFSIENLANGVYILNVITEKNEVNLKVIKN